MSTHCTQYSSSEIVEFKMMKQLRHLQNLQTYRRIKKTKKTKRVALPTSHHLTKRSPCSPASIHDTLISERFRPPSRLAAPFLPFCVGSKFSSEATVIVFHLGRGSGLLGHLLNSKREAGKRRRGTGKQG